MEHTILLTPPDKIAQLVKLCDLMGWQLESGGEAATQTPAEYFTIYCGEDKLGNAVVWAGGTYQIQIVWV